MDKDKYWTDCEDTGHYILIPPTSIVRHQDLVIRDDTIAFKQRFDNSEIAWRNWEFGLIDQMVKIITKTFQTPTSSDQMKAGSALTVSCLVVRIVRMIRHQRHALWFGLDKTTWNLLQQQGSSKYIHLSQLQLDMSLPPSQPCQAQPTRVVRSSRQMTIQWMVWFELCLESNRHRQHPVLLDIKNFDDFQEFPVERRFDGKLTFKTGLWWLYLAVLYSNASLSVEFNNWNEDSRSSANSPGRVLNL